MFLRLGMVLLDEDVSLAEDGCCSLRTRKVGVVSCCPDVGIFIVSESIFIHIDVALRISKA